MRPGEVIAERFKIERLVGSGGMGHVYRARDLRGGALVAVKKLQRPEPADIDRFAREAQILSMLDHPGIVRYIAYGATPGEEPHLVMEWLEGETLFERLKRAPLTLAETLAIGCRVAAALGVAHRSAIVHRDIKPGNIFLRGSSIEDATLLDFGIARQPHTTMQLTATGAMLGTPGYMAPEQARGAPDVDVRADVFSLGCVLFRCLSGRPAFAGDDALSVLFKVIAEDPSRLHELRPEIPRELDDLVARMLSKSPDSRPHDGDAVAAELAEIMSGNASSSPCSRAEAEIMSTARQVMCLVLARGCSKSDATLSDATAAERERTLCALAERHQGRLETLGDGSVLILLSGADTATDLAARAARCALAIRSLLDGVPVVVVSGRDILGPRLPAGELIDRAVQLLRSTESATRVRVDVVTAGLLDACFDIDADSTGPWLRGQLRDPDGTRLLLGKPTTCMGRERELGQLELIFAQCVEEPVASAALLTASAGVGKSRICHEFLRKLRGRGDAVEIWIARGDSLHAGSAFGLLGKALRGACGILEGESLPVRREKLRARVAERVAERERPRVVEFLGELVGTPFPEEESVLLRAARHDAQLMGDQMRRAWVDFLDGMCSGGPVLLVLEDLHWGDLPTVQFIDEALRRFKDKPWMVLGVARPEVHALFPNLWAERSVQEIRVKELSPKASARLVRQVLGDGVRAETVERLVAQADGNAFYLEELIRATAEASRDAFPETVLAMVQSRLERLDGTAQRLLRAASVFGRSFWQGGVAALLGGGAFVPWLSKHLARLEQLEWIHARLEAKTQGDREMVFRHALAREAVYATLTEADRTLGHRLAGRWLEQSGHTDAMTLAEHYWRGEEPACAAQWYRRAAEEALLANDLPAVLDRAQRGVACGSSGEDLGRLRLVEAEAYLWRGELAAAEERGTQATELLAAGCAEWFRAVGRVGIAAGKLGELDAVERWAQRATAQSPTRGARSSRIICLSECADELILSGRYAVADVLIEEFDPSEALDAEAIAHIHQTRAFRAMTAGGLGGCLEGLNAALAAFEQAGDHRYAASTRVNLGFVYAELGDFEGAEGALRAALATADRMSISDLSANALHNLGRVLAVSGHLEEARADEEQAITAYAAQGHQRMEGASRTYLAGILRCAGELGTAEAEVRRALEVLEGMKPEQVLARGILADVLLARGQHAEALAEAREAMALLALLGTADGEALARLSYAEALAATGDHAAAYAAIAEARDRLFGQAARIGDLSRRKTFLENVPDNARTLDLARQWLGEPAAAPS